jgi:flagellar motor switch protein FliN/FliY
VTNEEALTHLANQTAESVSGVLQMFFGDGVTMSSAAIVPRGTPPLGAMPTPTIVSNISYTDGATGGNLFAVPVAGARALAAAMMGAMADDDAPSDDLSELEMSAVGEAANQMLAAAAAATSAVLGQEVEIDPPETRILKDLSHALDGYQQTQWMTSVSFQLGNEPCRLVQLVPQAFIVRMTQALQEQGEEIQVGPSSGVDGGDLLAAGMDAAWLEGARLRLSGELGRTRLPAGRVVDLAGGAIVPLDKRATDPIDLYVNGMPFARGRLVLVDESDWAVRIESITPTGSTAS